MLIAVFSPCFNLTWKICNYEDEKNSSHMNYAKHYLVKKQNDTFSIASTYCSTYLPTSSANFFVRRCESAFGASGIMEPYPVPVD